MAETGFIRYIETEIKNANMINAQTLAGNVEAHVVNTLGLIEADAQCRSVGAELIDTCSDLAGLHRLLVKTASQKEEIAALTEKALNLTADFEKECIRCGPNGKARALLMD